MSRLLRRFWKMGGSTVAWKRSSGGQGLRGPDPRERSARRHCLLRAGTIWGRSCWITSGKPDVRHESAAEWARRIAPLAAQEHVSCKLSGLITEAHWHGWDERDLLPYLDAALECFGPSRLLFGSDWPVCLLSGTYDQVCGLAGKATASLSEAERDAVWGGNACRVYGIGNL